MLPYSAITVIYNPKSTGPSERNAQTFAARLSRRTGGTPVDLQGSQYAGHAEALVQELAAASTNPLVVSSSGDGGYHELINGAMRARLRGHAVTTGLLPSGNANDHYHTLHKQAVESLIAQGVSQRIDLLDVRADLADGSRWQRYAHSYVGIGLTPKIATSLNQTDLNLWQESKIVIRTLRKLRGTPLLVDGQERTYDSLIFSNVNRMAKILRLSDDLVLDDGRFEVTAFRTRNKLSLLRSLVRASTTGMRTSRPVNAFQFTTLKSLRIQLDGEVYRLAARSTVNIQSARRVHACIV